MLLAGDIGGTKTDLAIYSTDKGPCLPLAQTEFPSGDYNTFEDLIRQFLDQVKLPVDRAAFDVAGPVINGKAKVTNLPWEVDERTLQQELGLRSVKLINDLEAVSRAVPVLEADDLVTLNAGVVEQGGAIAVIAPGTGLGEGFLTWDGKAYKAFPSEGGHGDFAPTNENEIALLQYLMQRFPHVSAERVCSGKGIPNIYDYLHASGMAETPAIAAQLAAAKDKTPIIVREGVEQNESCPLCAATLGMFIDALAAEASNMALKVLSTGGVYIGGGLPPRMLPLLEDGRFMRVFTRKGRFADILSRMPVHVITSKAAMIGVANYGLEMAQPE